MLKHHNEQKEINIKRIGVVVEHWAPTPEGNFFSVSLTVSRPKWFLVNGYIEQGGGAINVGRNRWLDHVQTTHTMSLVYCPSGTVMGGLGWLQCVVPSTQGF